MQKNLVKTLILTTCFSLYPARSTESRIADLELLLTQKMHQLSEIGEQISQKQKLIEGIWYDMKAHLADRITELSLEGNAAEEFVSVTYAGGKKFQKVMEDAFIMKKNMKGLLVNEFIDEEKMLPDCFNAQKFWSLKGFLEFQLLKRLIEEYEVCIEEMHCIMRELEVLKNHELK